MKTQIFATSLMALAALPVAAQEVTPDTVVATVNGGDITMTHVLDVRRQLPQQYQSLPAETLLPGIVDQLIQQRVLAAQLVEEPAWLDEAVENTVNSLRAGLVLAELGQVEVSDADVQAAYDAQFADFEGAPEFNASHILVATEEEAASLITQLEEGADFAELAMEFSTGPSGPRGGELGWFGPGMMVAPFEEAVVALEPGGVSAPVQTQFGWHVITLNDMRVSPPPALSDVRADIVGQLQSERLEARMQEFMTSADITRVDGIDPAALNSLNIFSQ
ncbi:MAG: peptidylprolyl isomerase [Pseudomonadota bacterium]